MGSHTIPRIAADQWSALGLCMLSLKLDTQSESMLCRYPKRHIINCSHRNWERVSLHVYASCISYTHSVHRIHTYVRHDYNASSCRERHVNDISKQHVTHQSMLHGCRGTSLRSSPVSGSDCGCWHSLVSSSEVPSPNLVMISSSDGDIDATNLSTNKVLFQHLLLRHRPSPTAR